jgi:ATP-dependent Clp protease protease subunit
VATDIEIHAKEIERARERINQLIAKETGKPLDQVARDTDRDYWLNSDEAKEYNLIKRVVATRADLGI